MKKILYIIIYFSQLFSHQIINLSGDMNTFSMMNCKSALDKNHRAHNSSNIISASFIQLPSEILLSEIFYQYEYKNFIISPRIALLDFGTLSDINDYEFNASEKLIELTIHKTFLDNINYGISMGYSASNIDSYSSSILIYSLGIRKSFIDNQLSIGLSLENNIKVLSEYSNFNNSYKSQRRASIDYSLRYLPLHILLDYVHKDYKNSNFIIGLSAKLSDNLLLFSGKRLYFLNYELDNEFTLFDNISTGLGILTEKIKFNFGVQIHNYNTYIGTSVEIKIK